MQPNLLPAGVASSEQSRMSAGHDRFSGAVVLHIEKSEDVAMRSTMGETSLSALALMACHPDAVPAPRAVLDRVMLSKKRRIQ